MPGGDGYARRRQAEIFQQCIAQRAPAGAGGIRREGRFGPERRIELSRTVRDWPTTIAPRKSCRAAWIASGSMFSPISRAISASEGSGQRQRAKCHLQVFVRRDLAVQAREVPARSAACGHRDKPASPRPARRSASAFNASHRLNRSLSLRARKTVSACFCVEIRLIGAENPRLIDRVGSAATPENRLSGGACAGG